MWRVSQFHHQGTTPQGLPCCSGVKLSKIMRQTKHPLSWAVPVSCLGHSDTQVTSTLQDVKWQPLFSTPRNTFQKFPWLCHLLPFLLCHQNHCCDYLASIVALIHLLIRCSIRCSAPCITIIMSSDVPGHSCYSTKMWLNVSLDKKIEREMNEYSFIDFYIHMDLMLTKLLFSLFFTDLSLIFFSEDQKSRALETPYNNLPVVRHSKVPTHLPSPFKSPPSPFIWPVTRKFPCI